MSNLSREKYENLQFFIIFTLLTGKNTQKNGDDIKKENRNYLISLAICLNLGC